MANKHQLSIFLKTISFAIWYKWFSLAMASEATTTKAAPKPVFLLQNSKPITKVLFSNVHPDLLYSGNRNGDFNVYNLKSRRSLFQHNTESQSILSILELDSNHLLTYARNGSIYEWTSHESKYDANCEF